MHSRHEVQPVGVDEQRFGRRGRCGGFAEQTPPDGFIGRVDFAAGI